MVTVGDTESNILLITDKFEALIPEPIFMPDELRKTLFFIRIVFIMGLGYWVFGFGNHGQ